MPLPACLLPGLAFGRGHGGGPLPGEGSSEIRGRAVVVVDGCWCRESRRDRGWLDLVLVTLDRGEPEAIEEGVHCIDPRLVGDELLDLDHLPILAHHLPGVPFPVGDLVQGLDPIWHGTQKRKLGGRPNVAPQVLPLGLEAGRPAVTPDPALDRGDRDPKSAGDRRGVLLVLVRPELIGRLPIGGEKVGSEGHGVRACMRHARSLAETCRLYVGMLIR